jgi:hypothetical protein
MEKVKEDTSLSPSGLHLGHNIAGADNNYISQFHALCMALKKGMALERLGKWIVGYVREDVWCTISLKTPCHSADRSKL